MLWSLIKILVFVGLTAALAFGGGLLLESSGHIRVTAFGTELTLGPLQAAILAIVIVIIIWLTLILSGLVIAVLKFINGDETAISRYFDRNRERRGFEALADGMMALASGEGRVAMARAARAEKYLGRPELTNLLAAQAAEMAGDKTKAEEVYKRLLQDERTRFVGVRGIMKQKLADGDTDTALELAERAFALKPRHEETMDILLRLQAGKGDWGGARRTLGAKLRSGSLPRDIHRRRDAVLALSEADATRADDGDKANEGAVSANRLSPDLVPGAVAAARALVEQGKIRQATKILRKAWDATPHPDLAAAFADLAPDEDPQARLKRFQVLTKSHADNAETRQLLAELNIAAEDFPAARAALGDLPDNDPTARSLALLAAVERGSGADDALVRGILTRALSAPRGPHWVCDNCQTVHGTWAATCNNCQALDTFTWRRPPNDVTTIAAATQTLTPALEIADATPEPAEVAETPPEPDDQVDDILEAEETQATAPDPSQDEKPHEAAT